jgi:glycerophosphoryl diester phosphodiesterase
MRSIDGATTRRSSIGFARALAALAVVLATHAAAFDLQAHRGGRGLRPENTIAAFENAIAIGVTTLELDIAITADGVPVISHDPFVNPALARDGEGRWLADAGPLIRSLTLAELQRYDVGRLNPGHAYGRTFAEQQANDGERIPTLAALFARVRELGATDVQFDIETKVFPDRPGDTVAPDEFVARLLAVIRSAGMRDRVMIQSFDWRTLAIVQRVEPGMRTVYLTTQGRGGGNVADPRWTGGLKRSEHASVAHMVMAAGGSTWAPNFNDLDEASVRTAHSLGLQVVPWTVNAIADMKRLVDWGVDGLITDYPDRLRDVLRERGVPLPAAVSPRRAP